MKILISDWNREDSKTSQAMEGPLFVIWDIQIPEMLTFHVM